MDPIVIASSVSRMMDVIKATQGTTLEEPISTNLVHVEKTFKCQRCGKYLQISRLTKEYSQYTQEKSLLNASNVASALGFQVIYNDMKNTHWREAFEMQSV